MSKDKRVGPAGLPRLGGGGMNQIVRRGTTALAAGGLAIALLAGCTDASNGADSAPAASPASDAAENLHVEWFEHAYANATNEFTRNILSDGVVTTAERDEALQRANECLERGGLEALIVEGDWGIEWEAQRFTEEGGIGFSFVDEAEGIEWVFDADGGPQPLPWVAELVQECSDAYMSVVSLYLSVSQDPEGIGRDQMIVNCLRRHNLVDGGFTVDTLLELLGPPHPVGCDEARADPRWMDVECRPDGTIRSMTANPDWVEPPRNLPGGGSLDHGPGQECLWDPLY